jgi:hypothetical protein
MLKQKSFFNADCTCFFGSPDEVKAKCEKRYNVLVFLISRFQDFKISTELDVSHRFSLPLFPVIAVKSRQNGTRSAIP